MPGRPARKGRGLFGALSHDLTAAVVAALRAYPVVHYGSTAVRAYAQGGDGSEIVGPSLVSSLLGELMFRMCHCCILLKYYCFLSKSPFSAENGLSSEVSCASLSSLRYRTVALSHSPSGWTLLRGSESIT